MVKGKIEIYNFPCVLFLWCSLLMCFVFAFIVLSRKVIMFFFFTTYVDNIYFEKLMVKCVCAQDVICSRKG
jgi:hypothetical protein